VRKILFLFLPLFLCADIKFSCAASLDEEVKIYAQTSAKNIEDALQITLIKNFESKIYEDEAALYALKNGIIKFTVVRKALFENMGLEQTNMRHYGFEPISQKDGFLVLVQSHFFDSIPSAKKTKLNALMSSKE